MLIVIRHGQTDANAKGLLLGRLDPELTPLGRRQAAALARGLPAPALVVSSPLARARQTAAAFSDDVRVDERWIEMDYGESDGLPGQDAPLPLWRQWRADPDFAPPGGESIGAVGSRVREACEELAALAVDRDVVVVTHVSPIKAAVAWALDVHDGIAWRMYVEDGAACRISVTPHGPLLRSFNEIYRP